jgi:Zn-dependent oligopeptidase
MDDHEAEENTLLGTIYFDPFADAYWRTAKAEELNITRLLSKHVHQTVVPVVVMALKIRPTWDDAPAPVSWDDTRDLLFHFGKALQMILVQASKRNDARGQKAPIDLSDFLGHVSLFSTRLSSSYPVIIQLNV